MMTRVTTTRHCEELHPRQATKQSSGSYQIASPASFNGRARNDGTRNHNA
jgi:hypothetical protein